MGNLLRAGILFLFLSILLPQLHAQQLNDYRSSTSGNWASASTWERFDGADWVTATAAPTSFDGAITIQNTHTVTVAATASADQITVESGGILALSSTLSLSDGAGTDLLIQGNFNWNSGTLGGVGTIEVANGGVFSLLTTSTKTIRSTLTNNGTIDWQDGILNSSVAIQLINNQTFNISGNNTLGGAGSQLSVVNNGTINKTSTGITECSPGGPFSNNGTLNFNAGIFRVSGNNSWVNAGNLNHDGGSFEFAVSSGSFFNFAGSAIGGTGTFKINSGTLELNSNLVFPSTVEFFLGTATTFAEITGPGNLTVNSDFTINTIASSTNRGITGTGTLTLNGNIIWNTGGIIRSFTVQAGKTLTLANGATQNAKILSANLINNGTIDWQSGDITPFPGTNITNNGQLNITGNNSLFDQFGGVTFLNPGTITKTSTGSSTIFDRFSNFNNSGTIKGVGTLFLGATVTNTGTIAPGLSPGILTLNFQQPFSSTSTLAIEIAGNGGAGAANGHDQVQRSGNLTLAGAISVSETGTVPEGDYIIVSPTSGSITGTFASTNLPPDYTLIYNSNEVVLRKGEKTQSFQFRSATSGNWANASTWERFDGTDWVPAATAPSSADSLITIRPTHTVTVAASVTADQITVESGGILALSSTLTLANGIGTDLLIQGTFNWNSGTLGGQGTTEVANGGTFSILTNTTKTIGSPFTNNGTVNWEAGNILTSTPQPLLNNGQWNITGNNTISASANQPNFTNTGTITKTSTATTEFASFGTFTNSGTINLNAGLFRVGGNTTWINSGNLSHGGGSFEFAVSSGSFVHGTGSLITGTGKFILTSGILNLNENQVFPSTLIFSIGPLATINVAGNLTLNQDFTMQGTIQGSGTLTINGNTTWTGGVLGMVFTNPSSSTITLSTTNTKTLRAILTNNGTIDWQDGTLNSSVATQLINNQTFNISGNNTLGGAGSQLSVVNNGTINKTSNGTTEWSPGGLFSNNGTFNFNAGIFRVTGNTTWINFGNLNHGGGSFEFAVSSGSFLHRDGSVIGGTGSFKINSGTLELNSNLVLPSTVEFFLGTATTFGEINGPGNLTVNSDFTINTIADFNNRGITGTGTLTLNGNIIWNTGGIIRSFTVQPGKTLTLANGAIQNAKILSATLVNNGTIDWQSGNISTLPGTNITNNGQLNITGNNSLSSFGGVTFLNPGTITKTSTGTSTIFNAESNFNNSGTIKGVGTLFLGGTITNTGTIAPGLSPGILTLNGRQPFSSTSTFAIEIAGNGNAGAANGHDQVQRSGNLTLAGAISVSETGTVPEGDYVIVSLTSGTITGTFEKTNLPADYTLVYTSNSVIARKRLSFAQFRSATSGNWATAATWQRFDGTDWVAAVVAPVSTDGNITIRNTHTVTVAAIATADQITVESGGTLALSSTLNLADGTGTDLLIQGTFNWNSGTLGGPGTTEVANGGVISLLTTSTKTIGSPFTNNGTVNWEGGNLLTSTSQPLVNNSQFNISGNNTISASANQPSFNNTGTITKTSSGITEFSSSSLPFTNSGTINLNAGTFISRNTVFTNTGNLNFDGGTFELINQFFKHNSGSVIGGTGTFKVTSGTLEINSDLIFPTTVFFSLGTPSTFPEITGAGNLTINNDFDFYTVADPSRGIAGMGTLTVNGNTTWNRGLLARSFTVQAGRTLILATTGAKNIGASIINNGTLDWQAGDISAFSGKNITNNNQFTISGNNSISNSFGGVTITNTGTIIKTSTGTTTLLSSVSTSSINNSGTLKGIGTLSLGAPVTNTGTIAPGLSPGILTLNTQQPFGANSTLAIEIAGNGGAGVANGHDQVQRAGNLTLAGTLTVTETGTVPDGDYVIVSLTSGTITGTFSTTKLPANYTVVYNSTNVVLRKAVQQPSQYRSIISGDWTIPSIWERFDGTNWVPATVSPTSADGQITIRSPHSVNYNTNISVDEVLVESGATLSINGGFAINNGAADHDVIINGNLTYSTGTISGTGTLLVNGTMSWNTAFNLVGNDISAPTIISSGAEMSIIGSYAILTGPMTNNGTVNLSNGALGFRPNGLFTNNETFNITNTATEFGFQGAAPGFTNSSTGTVTKSNSGSFLLGTNFTNSGTLTIQTGTWQNGGGTTFANSGSIGLSNNAVFRNSGSTIQFNSGTSISGTGSLQIAGGTTSFNSAVNLPSTVGLDFSLGTINGTGSLIVNGIMNWNSGFGNHGYVVSTTITQTGTLNIGGSYAVLSSSLINNGTTNLTSGVLGFGANGGFTNNGTFNIPNTATDFGFQGSGPGFINSSTGIVIKSSTGTFTFGIPSTNSGLIKGIGALQISSTFSNTGKINPGLSPGILVLNGTQPLSASSTLEIEIAGNAGAGAANGHDQLQRAGNLTLAGTLTVAETGTVPNGDYVILTLASGSITGTFATTNLPPNYSLVYNTNNVILRKAEPVVNVVLSGALTGNFTTLGSAFAFINAQGGSGNVTATILGNTSETSQVVLNQTGYTVLVVPEGNRTISGNLSTPLVLLNGADNVTIDGLSFDGNNRLTIRNINTNAEANAVRIFGSANNNTIRRCTLEGSGVGINFFTGIITLSSSNADFSENNTIDNNLIRPASSSGASNGIMVSTLNSTNTGKIVNARITNNRIENVFINNVNDVNHGIVTGFNVDNITIQGNSVYNTATFSNTRNNSFYYGIRISNSSGGNGSGSIVSDNFIGGTEPEAKGGKMVISSPANSLNFAGIVINDNTNAPNSITGNVVKNLSLDIANPTTSALSPFIGIWSLSGNVQEYNQNMVGDSLMNNSILLTMRPASTGGLTSYGQLIQTAVATDIANNFVGGLSITTNPIAGSTVAPGLNLINISGNHPSLTLRNNKIGSDLEGSISITSNTSGSFLFRGLIAQSSNLNPVSVLDKNSVQNITVTNRVDLLAITYFNNTSSATPNVSITNNKIQKIRVSGTGGGLAGIFYNSNGPVNNLSQTLQVSGNQLSDLIGVSGTNLAMTGIRVQNLSPDVNRMKGSISGNTVRSMTNLATGSSGNSRGIAIAHDITLGDSLVIAENLIEKISSATEFVTSNNVGTSMGLSYGAVNSGTNGLAIIRDNTIKEIASTSTANLALTTFGISLFGNNLLIERNKVFDLTNAATSPNGKITGIYIQTRTDDSSIGRIQNNKIALNTTSPVKIQGIELGDGVVNSKIYHNSVLIEGNSTTSSYALFKKAVAIADVKNNILYNATQGSGTAFSLGLETSATGYTGNNNYLVSPAAASLAEIGGAAQTLTSWKSTTSQDSESRDAESGITTISENLFTDKSVANLLIKVENIGEASRISDKGIAIPTVNKDFQGEARNAATPDIGADEFELTGICAPEVSIEANPGNEVCEGTSVTFTATPVNGGDAPVYQWKLNGNNVGTNAPTYTNAALANGDQVSVVMTSSAACASPTSATSNTVTMTVTSTLVPSVSIAANPGNEICTGTSVTFTATPVNGGDAPVYQWKLNGNNVGTNAATYTNASLANGDQVSVVMTSSAACANPSAATSNTVTMTVTSTLVPSVSIAANPGNQICTGTSVTFTATPVNGGDAPVYQWKLNGNNVGINSPTYTNAALANGDQVSVVMTSSAACASPTSTTSNTVTMTVTSTLVPSVSIAANPGNQICTGTSVTFTATPVNGGDAPVYQWKLNGNNVGTNAPTYTNAALANGDQMSVVMTSSAACASPSAVTSNTVTMTVTSTLVPSVSIAANPGNQICTGTSVTFTATPVNGGDAPVYQWKLNGNNVGTNAPTYTNASLTNGDQVSVMMTSSAACASPSAATSNTVAIAISSLTTYYQDLDGDGYGNPAESIQSCTKPSGYVENNTDCNDYLAAINPGAIEICGNGIDENCNGMDDDVCSEVIPILRTRTYAIKEGDRGIIPAVLEVTLDSEATQEVSLNYTTVDEQARAGEDYVATSGVLIIPTGSRSGQISIGIIGDTRQESNERFAIQFSSPINVRLPENPISSVLILDDDKAPKVSVLLKQGELWKVKHVPGQIEELTIFTQNGFQLYQKNNLSNELQLPYFAPGSYFFAVRFQDEYGDYQLMQGVLIIKN